MRGKQPEAKAHREGAKSAKVARRSSFYKNNFAHPSRPLLLRGVLLLLLAAPSARAAGVGIPDLGAAGLGQAGATVARPAGLTALYYNPGALGFLEGIQAYVDVRLVDQRVTFQRLDSLGQNPQ